MVGQTDGQKAQLRLSVTDLEALLEIEEKSREEDMVMANESVFQLVKEQL